MTMTAAELVASKKHILLDFDGPICAAFAGYGAANISRQLATLITQGGEHVPPELFTSPDPFELFRYAATLGCPEVLAEVDAEFRRLEAIAVRLASPTADATTVMRIMASTGRSITVVSNNSVEAVQFYTRLHGLDSILAGVSARTDSDPSLLKPNPHLVLCALSARGALPSESVMIGDSPSDVHAAHAAGVAAIGLANRPEKRIKLLAAQPEELIDSMKELR